MNLGQARAELQNIIGADLENDEADSLINEAEKELCVRAEWTQSTLSIGPTVIDQVAYAMPASVHHPLKLWVNGLSYMPSGADTVARITSGSLRLVANGVWYLGFDDSGTESFNIYPIPGTADLEITALCVVYPPDLDADSDESVTPSEFHKAHVFYAAARSLGGSEDNLDARSYYVNEYELLVSRLKRLRRSRGGHGVVDMKIVGATY